GPRKLLLAEAVILAAALLLRRRGGRQDAPSLSPEAREALRLPLLAAAAAGALLFSGSALAEPIWATDFLAIWGLKAKTIFFASGIPETLFRDPAQAWSHPEYPLFLPLLFASLAAFARDWNDRALALLYPALHLGTILGAYGFLRRRVNRMAGAVAAALIGLFLPLYRAGHVGMADIPLAFGLVLLSCAFLDAREASSASVHVRLALASLFCAATKQEGLVYVVLLAATWLVARQRVDSAGRAAALAVLLLPAAIHWVVLRAARGPLRNRDFDWTLLAPGRWPELFERLGEVGVRVLTVEAGGAAVGLLAIAVLLISTRRGPEDLLLLPMTAQVLVYAAIGALSSFGAVWLVQTSFARIVSALFPPFALVLGARSGRLFERAAR
ncbi:MAG: hypothetical protein H7X85_01875, partial [Thermoanaerobaculia bacterium]|nr:hypothetical protein [Thermoanaerobaculia bacterium]